LKFKVLIDHLWRNQALCGEAEFDLNSLWSRAQPTPQKVMVPLYKKGDQTGVLQINLALQGGENSSSTFGRGPPDTGACGAGGATPAQKAGYPATPGPAGQVGAAPQGRPVGPQAGGATPTAARATPGFDRGQQHDRYPKPDPRAMPEPCPQAAPYAAGGGDRYPPYGAYADPRRGADQPRRAEANGAPPRPAQPPPARPQAQAAPPPTTPTAGRPAQGGPPPAMPAAGRAPPPPATPAGRGLVLGPATPAAARNPPPKAPGPTNPGKPESGNWWNSFIDRG